MIAECRHGRASVKLLNADTDVLWFNSAAFRFPCRSKFADDLNNIQIDLIEKVDAAHKIKVSRVK